MRKFVKSCLGNTLVTRLLSRRGPATILTLMYHDLRDNADFGNWMRVSVSNFDAQLTMLGDLDHFVGPEALADPSRLAPDRLNILLTFDDGYVNNHRLALPLLAKHRAPALFFVSTRHMAEQRIFWTDVVVTAIQATALTELDLRDFGLSIHRFHPVDDDQRWNDIQRLLVTIKMAGNADHPNVAAVLGHLCETHAAVLDEHLPRFRPLNVEEVREMAGSDWCTFGGHGHDHGILTYLDDEQLDYNLREPRRILEETTGAPVVDLAYPNGDHDQRVLEHVATAGYTRAFTTLSGLTHTDTAPLALPRLGVGGYDSTATVRYLLTRILIRG